MLVSWEWLSEYVDLDIEPDELANRFAMSGLNHESTSIAGADCVLDLEVTSNRGDCLGHLGVAREAAVLLDKPLRIPSPEPSSGEQEIGRLCKVDNQFPQACGRYTARLLRGVRVGPSPEWLVRRLKAIGINSVNNVVDVTNYVMIECGQPLHAFDWKFIQGGKIVVRPAKPKEKLLAIDHRSYELDERMVVIADVERPIGLGGVMGGAETEVSQQTRDVLIEAAAFEPLSIRRTARLLKLHSPSSFRFERRPDPAGIDWASLRCCELIQQVAGGELCSGVAQAGELPATGGQVTLRLPQIPRLLGIDIPLAEITRILRALGCEFELGAEILLVRPPTWRNDLQREVDLIEEVARIYGYELIPENVFVPLSVAQQRPQDIAMKRARHTLSAYGIDEAMTASVVSEGLEELGSVWTERPALQTDTPLLAGARSLRRSLLPSLLVARHTNQTQAIRDAELYEVANVYLPGEGENALPQELSMLGIVTHSDFRFIKGLVEEIVEQIVATNLHVAWKTAESPFFHAGSLQRVCLGNRTLGFLGLVAPDVQRALSLDLPVAAAELRVDTLCDFLQEVRSAAAISPFPGITRDLNFVVDEATQWALLESTCRKATNELLTEVRYQETYRDAKKDGSGKKRVLLTLHFQSLQRTLTGEEVDSQVDKLVAACRQQLDAHLLS